MSVSAVVVTYNRLPFLKEVIQALQNSATIVDHIIIVDNNSNQETFDYLTALGDQIEYVRLDENIGGAGGFNRGVRYFMEHTNDEFVWLMDDDTVPNVTTLTELLAFAKQTPDFGFLASDVRWTDGTRAKMNNPAPKNRLKKIPEDATEPEELMNATFVSLLMKRDIINQIGLPITEFFIWGDDIEFTERAARIAPGYFVPAAKVTHKMAANVGSNIMNDSLDRLPRYFYSYRNKVYYGAKRNFIGHMKSNTRITLEAIRLMFAPNVDNRLKRLSVLIKGVKAGIVFRPEIEYVEK
ncbi:glycosyltransferase [Weissella confusa]|uniref:glycosyltransferase family 2 protein n=1 Tax=Weissella confusa TaxID=1583 RepID=UPI0002465DB4|nr:glycosyltransferase family 2 protein [Weissella confusa]MBJ7616611.1 glycosyltransferase [Weissella confusa]MBJ7627230.1 glycosyltransferase [Weissella confusa]MCT8392515.1 glycosyltransferase [Weissella confusa]CCF29830.1 dTDP-rhamnosyl transferase RfbF [Weissella confusa LBAE C39-2]